MKYTTAFTSALMCLAVMACAESNGGFPQVANPPAFDFADGDELRTGMHRLAFALQRLDAALDAEYEQSPTLQDSVLRDLEEIERISKSLRAGDLRTKHPFLIEGMENLLDDVERAQWYASNGRYYMAGRISGACVSCHRAND